MASCTCWTSSELSSAPRTSAAWRGWPSWDLGAPWVSTLTKQGTCSSAMQARSVPNLHPCLHQQYAVGYHLLLRHGCQLFPQLLTANQSSYFFLYYLCDLDLQEFNTMFWTRLLLPVCECKSRQNTTIAGAANAGEGERQGCSAGDRGA